jgi:exopolysaccharide production protein ExoQ
MTPPATTAQWTPRILALATLAAPLVAVLAPKGMVIVLGVAALLVLISFRWETRRWPAMPLLAAGVAATLAAWGGIGAFWAVDPADAAATAAKVASVCLGGLIVLAVAGEMPEKARGNARTALVVGFVVALAMLAFDVSTGGRLTNTVRAVSGMRLGEFRTAANTPAILLTLLVWPALSGLPRPRREWTSGFLIVALGGVIYPLDSMTAQMTLALGALVLVLARIGPRTLIRLVGLVVIVGMVAAPVIPRTLPTPAALLDVRPMLPLSFIHRVSIWQFSAERIAERPLLGWGMRAARHLDVRYSVAFPEEYVRADAAQRREASLAYFRANVIPLHPHNGALQLWLEMGAMGAALGLLVAVAALRAVRGFRDSWARAAGSALFVSAVTVACMSYGLWQSWWLAGLWLFAVLAVLAETGPGEAFPAGARPPLGEASRSPLARSGASGIPSHGRAAPGTVDGGPTASVGHGPGNQIPA